MLQHQIGPSWASNDAQSKYLSNTRVLQHLTTLTTDYWDASHSFIEPRIVDLARSLKNSQCFQISGRENAVEARIDGHGIGRASVGL